MMNMNMNMNMNTTMTMTMTMTMIPIVPRGIWHRAWGRKVWRASRDQCSRASEKVGSIVVGLCLSIVIVVYMFLCLEGGEESVRAITRRRRQITRPPESTTACNQRSNVGAHLCSVSMLRFSLFVLCFQLFYAKLDARLERRRGARNHPGPCMYIYIYIYICVCRTWVRGGRGQGGGGLLSSRERPAYIYIYIYIYIQC